MLFVHISKCRLFRVAGGAVVTFAKVTKEALWECLSFPECSERGS